MKWSTCIVIGRGVAGVALLLFPCVVRADVLLATFSHMGEGTIPADGSPPQWSPLLRYSNPADPPFGLMSSVPMTLLDVANGTVNELAGDFADFEATATSGTPHAIWVGFDDLGGSDSILATTEESLFVSGTVHVPGVGMPDFAGYDLTRITVLASSFQQTSTTTYQVTNEFSVYGDRVIPEPTAQGLAAGAAATILVMRRRGVASLA